MLLQVYVNLSDLEYKNSSVLYTQRAGQVDTVAIPRRIMSSIAEIIQRRNTGTEKQEDKIYEKVLKEISKINQKVESLSMMLNSYTEEADLKF